MQDFRKLKVWEKSHQLTLSIYKTTQYFPKEELYGINSQLRRSAASIATNIAEGCGRSGDNEFAHFITIAIGSASETEYHLILAHDIGYTDKDTYEKLIEQTNSVKKMLISLLKRIKEKQYH